MFSSLFEMLQCLPKLTPTCFAVTAAVALLPLKGSTMHIFPEGSIHRKQTGSNVLPSGWTSVGCFTDDALERTLQVSSFTSASMTPAACMEFCASSSSGFAGVEFSRECYCDFVIQDSGSQVDASQCNAPCTGDSNQTCGAGNRIDVFANGNPDVIHPQNKPLVGTWEYKGCFTEGLRTARNLQRMVILSAPMTTEACTSTCKAQGFILAGVENGEECWCGTFMQEGAKTPDVDCGSVCNGDSTEFCGAIVQNGGLTETTRMTVYQDTSVPVNLNVCLQTSTPFVQLISRTATSVTSAVNVINDNTFPANFFILSGCADCNAVDAIYEVDSGLLNPFIRFNRPEFDAESYTVNAGDSPVVFNSESPPATFSGYCVMPNPANSDGPLFQPHALGVNMRADLWALCPNITAAMRLDIVFAPVANHPHYIKSDCESIIIEINLIP